MAISELAAKLWGRPIAAVTIAGGILVGGATACVPTPPPTLSCAPVYGAYATEQAAFDIREKATNCNVARTVGSAALFTYKGEPFTLGGWMCTDYLDPAPGYPHFDYTCRAPGASITFKLSL
jgi:hypothetical protein